MVNKLKLRIIFFTTKYKICIITLIKNCLNINTMYTKDIALALIIFIYIKEKNR
jgi:hypothetical protein